MSIKEYDQLNHKFIKDITDLNGFEKFSFYFIIQAYNRINHKINDYYDAWIFTEGESWCVGLWFDGNYVLNSSQCNDEHTEIIKNRINFSNFPYNGFHFSGDSYLILKLSENNKNFDLEIYKDRYFYELLKSDYKEKAVENVEIANENDVDQIINHLINFHKEEWNGINDKDEEEAKTSIISSIKDGSIYKLTFDGQIVGYCCTINFTSKNDNMIGTIYISPDFRNNGYGKNLLNNVCAILLKNVENIYLMTDKNNVGSNKMLDKIGFKITSEYTDTTIQN